MPSTATGRPQGRLDLLQVPFLGTFLRHNFARPALQIILFAFAIIMILHGFLGPDMAPRNLATLLTWIHYRGILILVLVVAGNLFCMGCPFMLPRNIARRFARPSFQWPPWLRNKWLAIALFVGILFSYELFDLWNSPEWTASLIVAYFAGALVVDGLFKNASFCKYVCPLGQFNFAASTVSPLEIAVADYDVCQSCKTHDCIRGTHDEGVVIQRGCELALFQPKKVGNMDCTFCLDCVHACPHDNVAIQVRLPGSELFDDPRRSGIGRFSERKDVAVLALLFTFGALMNAFGMVSPVYTVQHWIAMAIGTHNEAPVLASLFGIVLVLEPALLLGLAAVWTRWASGSRDESLLTVGTRFAYALIPMGVGIWLAHYAFHFFTGLWTVVPVMQDALASIGFTLLGTPNWSLVGVPEMYVAPLEIGFLSLGMLGSVFVAYRIAQGEYPERAVSTAVPWAIVAALLWMASLWLLNQPMEMRGSGMMMM